VGARGAAGYELAELESILAGGRLHCTATMTKGAALMTTAVVLVALAFSVGCAEAKATTHVHQTKRSMRKGTKRR
jgi:hypothetical protein